MVPFWVPMIVRHLVFTLSQLGTDHNFDNYPREASNCLKLAEGRELL